jgi:hypothetical protein
MVIARIAILRMAQRKREIFAFATIPVQRGKELLFPRRVASTALQVLHRADIDSAEIRVFQGGMFQTPELQNEPRHHSSDHPRPCPHRRHPELGL